MSKVINQQRVSAHLVFLQTINFDFFKSPSFLYALPIMLYATVNRCLRYWNLKCVSVKQRISKCCTK